jgi:hypothetical protein
MSISELSISEKSFLKPKDWLLHVISMGCNTLVKSIHPGEENLFQGHFLNVPQNVLDGLKKFIPIGELISCQELLDMSE